MNAALGGVFLLSIFLLEGMTDFVWYVFLFIGAVVLFAIVVFLFAFGKLWLQALSSGCHVRVLDFVGMYLRRVSPRVIIDTLVMATKAGIPVDIDKLQAHVLARGNVRSVVQALVAASRARINLTFERGAAIDLAGRDVLDAVRTSVNPKVIDCPNPARGQPTIDGVSKNGIQLRTRARVTVRTNLDRLVGGATEETVIARVGQGIVAAIGMAEDHKEVLANPSRISKLVLSEGLDAGTAFEIVSIDIADINVGENIGAKLLTDQAEAQKRQAQAEADPELARRLEALEQGIASQRAREEDAFIERSKAHHLQVAQQSAEKFPHLAAFAREFPDRARDGIMAVLVEECQRIGRPVDISTAYGIIERELSARYELSPRADGKTNGEKGTTGSAPDAGRETSKEPPKPETAIAPATVPAALASTPGSANRPETPEEERARQIRELDAMGFFS